MTTPRTSGAVTLLFAGRGEFVAKRFEVLRPCPQIAASGSRT